MNLGINKEQAEQLLNQYITNPITRYHLLETEAIMKALAQYFHENEEEWGIIGLLHDIDWDLTKDEPKEHCLKAVEILKSAGASSELIEAVVSHGYGHKDCGAPQDKVRQTRLEHALAASETLTGLIVASALVQPDKKLKSVKLESLLKKFKSKSFAANCDRQMILECEKIGIKLEDFLDLGLKAMQKISEKISL